MQYKVSKKQSELIMDLFYTEHNNSSKNIAKKLCLNQALVDYCITKNLNKKYENFNQRKTKESSEINEKVS